MYTNFQLHDNLTGETRDERACIRCGHYRSAAETVNSGKAQMESRGAGPALGRDHHPTGADNQAAEPPCEACVQYAEAESKLKEAATRDPGETWVILSERECHHVYEERLRAEIERLTEALQLIAQPWPAPGFERADDVLQTIARRALAKGKEK
jgi:hypothetical protein